MKVCPACETKNDPKEKYCLNCGQKLIEDEDDTEIKEDKLTIPKDKIKSFRERSPKESMSMNWLTLSRTITSS